MRYIEQQLEDYFVRREPKEYTQESIDYDDYANNLRDEINYEKYLEQVKED